jgi:hypothetical protein
MSVLLVADPVGPHTTLTAARSAGDDFDAMAAGSRESKRPMRRIGRQAATAGVGLYIGLALMASAGAPAQALEQNPASPAAASEAAAVPALVNHKYRIEGGEASYWTLGAPSAVPLILINGGPGLDHSYFLTSPVWRDLARDRQVIVYDQRGTGKTISTSPLTEAHLVDYLEALRRHLGATGWPTPSAIPIRSLTWS